MEKGTTINATHGKVQARQSYFNNRKKRDYRDFVIFAGPAMVWFALLMLYPLLYMFQVSTLSWWGLLKPSAFIGLENYYHLFFEDPRFYIALKNTIIHLIVAPPVGLSLAFMLGFFLSQRPPGCRILLVIFFSPAILSVAAQSMMFVGIYLPNGVLNTLLRSASLDSLTRVWLANPATVWGSLIAIDIWGGIGFWSVLFYAVLSNIPAELYEAARMDGANGWIIMWRIAFPLILDFFGVGLMLAFIWIISGFSQTVILLTGGGPGNFSLDTGFLLYEQAFRIERLGYSQAIGVFIFVFGLLGMMLIRKITHRSYQL